MTKRILLWKCTLHKFCCRTIDTHMKFELNEKCSRPEKKHSSRIFSMVTNNSMVQTSFSHPRHHCEVKLHFHTKVHSIRINCWRRIQTQSSVLYSMTDRNRGSISLKHILKKAPSHHLRHDFRIFSLQKGDFLYFYSIAFLFNFNWSEMRIFSSELLLPFNDII